MKSAVVFSGKNINAKFVWELVPFYANLHRRHLKVAQSDLE